jgi:acetoin utilization deacetylase AcuC-like enzyme/GNAT superfamily N-acetyltransferase
MNASLLTPDLLSPGDQKSASLDPAQFIWNRIRAADDPLFEIAYLALWNEFGAAHEMETREVIAARFTANAAMRYDMILVRAAERIAAVRDQTVIWFEGEIIVHLSHLFVTPKWRRSGLAGWMRAAAVLSARAIASAHGKHDAAITLVGEMEYDDGSDPRCAVRLTAYERAGFSKIDPRVIHYFQPDFRLPSEIDTTGGAHPLPFQLILRCIGRETQTTITGADVRRIVRALYAMYGAQFRPQDMAHPALSLDAYPVDRAAVALVPPTSVTQPFGAAHSSATILTTFYHSGYAAPLGEHIMPIQKFALVADAVRKMPDVKLAEPAPVTEADLLRVHTAEYITSIRSGEPRALAESQKFPWSPQLFPSVCLTSGGCLAAARQALRDGASAALVSGFHHACADHGEGFCTFNGLVVTADALLAAGEANRIAVLDMDLHYGNGTAQLAANRPHIFAVSIYGNDYWANIPYRDVTVRRHADGENHRSHALPASCNRTTMLQVLDAALPEIAAWKPDLLLYQAGADPFSEDPFSPLAIDADDLQARDLRVFDFARQHGVPLAWVLAGGYTRDITKIVRIHTGTFDAWRAIRNGQQDTAPR